MDITKNETQKKNAVYKVAKIMRVLTVPPIMALAAFSAFLLTDGFYTSIWEYTLAVGFIALLPVCAYPLQLILPPFKHQGREGQRNLAFIMCNLGYVLSVIFAFAFKAGANVTTMLVTYLLSGMTLLLVNKLTGLRASGHSCGLLGPLAALVYFVGPRTLPVGVILFGFALWSSIYMKRHTLVQFIVGGIIPVFWLAVCVFVML
ncbi:MAG: hypothetical protein IJF69_01685 [Clostridia bacterium]|nr:hypothetical protein [Clostridia bacterium]